MVMLAHVHEGPFMESADFEVLWTLRRKRMSHHAHDDSTFWIGVDLDEDLREEDVHELVMHKVIPNVVRLHGITAVLFSKRQWSTAAYAA